MKLFIDSANMDEIREAASLGAVTGVTTNPSLAAKENIGDMNKYREVICEIAEIIDGPISVEVTAPDWGGMVTQAKLIAPWHRNVVVKLPSTLDGFKAMAIVVDAGIPVNQTLCFSLNQALIGSQIGATYVSPFVGRLDDEGHYGMGVVEEIVEAFDIHGISTQVLAASIRGPLHCVEAAKAGAHIATIPFKVLMQMTHHPLTDVGAAKFLEDWGKAAQA